MTSTPRKGSKVSFDAALATPPVDTWAKVSALRFAIDPPYGGELLVDLTDLRPRGLALAFARSLLMIVPPHGPVAVRSSIKAYVYRLPAFFDYLATTGDRITNVSDLRAHHIDGFEGWREMHGKSKVFSPMIVSKIINLLRRLAEDDPGLIDPGLRERLRFVSSHPHVSSSPRDAYSPFVARQLRDACRRDLADIEARLRTGPIFDDDTGCETATRAAHNVIEACGILGHREREWVTLLLQRRKMGLASPDLSLELHSAHYLTAMDIVPLIVLLSLSTGLEPECCKTLTIDCLRNKVGDTVEIAYTKLRAHGAEYKTLRVKDTVSTTPGGLIRRIIAMTAKARKHVDSNCLWLYYRPGAIVAGFRRSPSNIKAWTDRHAIVDDKGKPLELLFSRLRKTHKALWYLKTEGHMARFAVGHTLDVAPRHYADLPSLRPLHEQTIVDAFDEAVKGPRILTPEDEKRERSGNAGTEADRVPVTNAILNGEQDVWLASCGNFYARPFSPPGSPCSTPFWGCLDCGNAVITARKLPAILAFLEFINEQRGGMTRDDWLAKFGNVRERIVHQILPAFGDEVVARARAKIANQPPVLYLPPEART